MHEKLEPFSDQKNLKKFSTLLSYIEDDLVQSGCTGIEVKLMDKGQQRLSFAQFMGNENVADGDQAMVTTADRQGQAVMVYTPLLRGKPLPYKVTLSLDARTDGAATCRKNGWHFAPKNRERARQLKNLNLPSVSWSHARGVVSRSIFSLHVAHEISDNLEVAGTSTWVVSSGYQGFVNPRPKIAEYLEAASRLEALLNSDKYKSEHHIAALPTARVIQED